MTENKEIFALIQLLDDPDIEVFEKVKEKLITYSFEAIPILEATWEDTEDENTQIRIENIIQFIQFNETYRDLSLWVNSDNSLLKGYMILSKYIYPDINETEITLRINEIAKDLWLEINDNLTALEKVKVINHIFFDLYGFKCMQSDEVKLRNHFINNVIQNKKGSNLGLAIVYTIIAQRLNVPIMGVNLPDHFLLGYKNDATSTNENMFNEDVWFYLNIMSKGTVLSKREIDLYLKDMNIIPEPIYYVTCSNIDIIRLLISQMIVDFNKNNKPEKVNELNKLKNLLDLY